MNFQLDSNKYTLSKFIVVFVSIQYPVTGYLLKGLIMQEVRIRFNAYLLLHIPLESILIVSYFYN